ncbi:hypothetical protein Dimus_025023, partial [Dionaea muscipula]
QRGDDDQWSAPLDQAMLVRHGLRGIGSDLRRAASTCIMTVRREMFEASERRGQTELHRDSSNRS